MNPVLAFRQSKGWSRTKCAVVMDVDYQALYQLESGQNRAIPKKICEKIAELGGDAEKLCQDYAAWRENQRSLIVG